MTLSVSPKDIALYRAVDEVLHHVWDPIGVSSVPEARDEYHAYLPEVSGLVRGGNDVKALADHLARIAVDRMASLRGLPAAKATHRRLDSR
jgi:hypothetical protein